jgi:dTDP-4-amino-4,6-dideoxygalactose transaminase
MQVPFARPYFAGTEAAAVAAAVESGWVSQGPRVQAFEAAFAERVGAAEAIATTNCTTALQLALYVSGVGPGDEVIVPSLSFIATANSVWQCGATPVFADIEPDTYNLDPRAAERAITERTKAIMPVHQIGLPADMDPFLELAERHGVTIVEDAACAIGATYKGRRIGSLGPLACFSLHPRKVITSGEGGMITTSDPALADRLRKLRQHAMDVSDLARHNAQDVVIEGYPERGWNARMTDMQAALGLCQLELLDEILEERTRQAARYTAALEQIPGLEPPYEPPYAQRTWQSYPVRVTGASRLGRTELMRRLHHDGVATRRGVMAIHEEPAYAGTRAWLPHTERAARDVLLLPLFPGLGDDAQDYVIERLGAHQQAALAA